MRHTAERRMQQRDRQEAKLRGYIPSAFIDDEENEGINI